MKYKGYRILMSKPATIFYELGKDGYTGDRVEGIDYHQPDDDTYLWYAVIDKDNWVEQTCETLEEAKEYIREQLQ